MPIPTPSHNPNDLKMVLNSALSLSIITVDPEGTITGFSRGSELMLGYCAKEIINRQSPLLFHDLEEIRVRADELTAQFGSPVEGFSVFVAELSAVPVVEREWTYIRKDGSRLTVSLAISEMHDEAGTLQGYLGAAVDITARKRAEQSLLHEKYFFNQLINSLPGIFYLYDADLRLRRWNRNHETLLGFSSGEMNGRHLGDWHATEEGRNLAVMASKGIIEQGVSLDAVEGSLLHKNGKEIPFLLTGVRIETPDGPMLAGVGIDLTERRRLEEELHQSQKMESIGRLAGGVAHDFNNILTTIMGNVDLARSLSLPGNIVPYLDNAMKAADSAAKLTRQLLAFSRKELIAPRVLDLNDVLESMREMLIRLLGEDVELITRTANDLWLTSIDPSQVNQIILNLAVNARDAMPDGGSLSLETANMILDESYTARHPFAIPGEYVMLTASDTGTGMTPEVMSHLFEPFFTTKELGRGTGLGLATVFGAVKQNKGMVDVYSEIGVGSTFKVMLPRATGVKEQLRQTSMNTRVPRGSETIILAEDDPGIRAIAEENLTLLGYRVLACADGQSALDASIAAGTIDLLVTDLIMPGGMNGRELAERLQARHPNMRVLYTSGYTADIIGRHGMLEPDVDFLPKPYIPAELARRIRASLESS